MMIMFCCCFRQSVDTGRTSSSPLRPCGVHAAMDLHALSNLSAQERQWIDEVRYLHSLWRQGPPRNPTPNPTLRPVSSTSFKKENRPKKQESGRKPQIQKKKKTPQQHSDPETPSSYDAKWPVEPPPEPRPQTGWGDPKPQAAAPSTRPATAEEQAKLAAVQLQRNAMKSCQGFFSKKDSSDSEEDDEEEEDLMEDDEGDSEIFKFFLGLFSDDGDLRSYYEKNFERGEFFCLACAGIGEKIGKRFGNCVALVQHSTSISKTKGKMAHRAFGKAICRVLGWNINRLPSIVLDLGEPLSRCLAKDKSQDVGLGEDGAINQGNP